MAYYPITSVARNFDWVCVCVCVCVWVDGTSFKQGSCEYQKQGSCEYQLLKCFDLTRPGNRTLVYRLRGEWWMGGGGANWKKIWTLSW